MSPSRIRTHGFREHANADIELGRHFIEHRLHNRGHARHHDYIADLEAKCPRHLVEDEIRTLGMRVMRRRAPRSSRRGRLQPFVQDGATPGQSRMGRRVVEKKNAAHPRPRRCPKKKFDAKIHAAVV
jgi:hypothetical protein